MSGIRLFLWTAAFLFGSSVWARTAQQTAANERIQALVSAGNKAKSVAPLRGRAREEIRNAVKPSAAPQALKEVVNGANERIKALAEAPDKKYTLGKALKVDKEAPDTIKTAAKKHHHHHSRKHKIEKDIKTEKRLVVVAEKAARLAAIAAVKVNKLEKKSEQLAQIRAEEEEGPSKAKHAAHHAKAAQRGFMAIVLHDLVRSAPQRNKKAKQPLDSARAVHNLLWTAVALAAEKLAFGHAKGEQAECLLLFLAQTVGGAFAPFAESTKHAAHFVAELRKNQMAFLSSGYHHFWKKRHGGIKALTEAERKLKPVFTNRS